MIGLGELYREWNQLELADEIICKGVELVERWSKSWAIEGYTGKALVMQSAGNHSQALLAINKAEELAAAYDASEMDDLGVKLTQLRIYLMQGRLDSVELWFQEHGLIEKVNQLPVPYSLLEMDKILHAEYLVRKNDLGAALQVIDEIQDSAQKLGRYGSLINILAIKSLAFYRSGDWDKALQSILDALNLAETENYKRVFLDEGQPMLRILYEAIAGGVVNPYASKLIMDFELLNNTKPFHPPDSTSGITDQELFIEPLSDREREVLILISRGLSNREISQNLYISLRTVKWHTGNIFQKLGVKNRTQAVNKARILGIL
jgi:LuxR family maltose regulon positive regulatory protein